MMVRIRGIIPKWPNKEIVPFRLVNYIAIQPALLLGYNRAMVTYPFAASALPGIIHVYIYIYELQPKFRLMESSIRDIFIFWKLSWGLENDNTLFKKR